MSSRLFLSIAALMVAAPAIAAPPCNCVPTTHQVRIPGVVVEAPVVDNGSGWSSTGGGSSSSSSASASASATGLAQVGVSTQVSVSASLGQTSSAAANLISGGGGGGWISESGPTTSISSLQVETAPLLERVCAEYSAVLREMRIDASCVDDLGVPHPASQTRPDRLLDSHFEGEIFRCIAGARLQYTVSELSGGAGRTLTCDKSQALNLTAAGQLLCKAQIPARDCNERSLLRRFGPGFKQAKLAANRVCVAWRDGPAESQASADPAIGYEGGVGSGVRY